MSDININDLVREAQTRWLKPHEVHFILQNHESHHLTHEPLKMPTSGKLFLINKRVLRFFRKDGHSWKKKRDGRTLAEAHERLKVDNVESLNCYYAHGEDNPNLCRRSYWMLDPAYDHIVLVHYREIVKGRYSSLTPPTHFIPSPGSYYSQNFSSPSTTSDLCDSYKNFSSPVSLEANSDVVSKNNGFDCVAKINEAEEVFQALRRLEEQLSLDDETLNEVDAIRYENKNDLNDFPIFEYERATKQDYCLLEDKFNNHDCANSYAEIQGCGSNGVHPQQSFEDQNTFRGQGSLYCKKMLEMHSSPSISECHEGHTNSMEMNEKPSSINSGLSEQHLNFDRLNFGRNSAGNSAALQLQEAGILKFSPYVFPLNTCEMQLNYPTIGSDISTEMSFEANSNLISQNQKFTIREISPDWGFATDFTKIIIVGSFLCEPSESVWSCLIGDAEVPVLIIQDGVLCCHAPPHVPGKVTICVTSSNREPCSEVREFEYSPNSTDCHRCSLAPMEKSSVSREELLLRVRFIQMLLSHPLMQKKVNDFDPGIRLLRDTKADGESWSNVIECLLIGTGTSSDTMDWLFQEVLKDKLEQWISYRLNGTFAKNEQAMIHMAAGLGFEWALKPILSCGVNINFRDINGWTALHWAARFGREKMVAALIALGASAVAVTDPNSHEPVGKTPASIAAASGHKGLAGYLSELALTTHLSSLALSFHETEFSKATADAEAEITVSSVSSKQNLGASEYEISLKDTLMAVRNATLAAARIQSAFRAHSFKRRIQMSERELLVDDYGLGLTKSEIHVISSKLALHSVRDQNNAAALSIQKKYRGWKRRKDFLNLRQKVVTIQAHVRGHQARNKMICWAVGILEKVVLRWRRGKAGLRGFRADKMDSMNENHAEDEDIVKTFRKEKVEVAIDEALSRVLSMVDSPGARLQYHRVLHGVRQAKVELGDNSSISGKR